MSAEASTTAWYAYTSSTQTMRTWARRIKSHEDLPKAFQGILHDQDQLSPYTVYIPEDRFSLFGRRHGKLLCLSDDRLVLFEARGDRILHSSCSLDDVMSITRGTVLLMSWFIIRTISGTLKVQFNTTNMECFEPILKRLRSQCAPMASSDAPEEHRKELAKFDFLTSVYYKYMNYARQSLGVGDTVVDMAYQPERCIYEGVSLFKKTLFRRYATSHLSILTERELILIKEPAATRYERTTLYGGIFTYIARPNIRSISFVPDSEAALCTMTVALPVNIRHTSELSLDNESLKTFQQACQKL